MEGDTTTTTTKKKASGSNAMRFMTLLLVLAVGAAAFFYVQYQGAASETPEAIAAKNSEETAHVLDELGSVLLITEDTDPTVAKVNDADALKAVNSDFYVNTANGDYLVLYPTRAIVFRLEDKMIVNIAPIVNTGDITSNNATDTPADTQATE